MPHVFGAGDGTLLKTSNAEGGYDIVCSPARPCVVRVESTQDGTNWYPHEMAWEPGDVWKVFARAAMVCDSCTGVRLMAREIVDGVARWVPHATFIADIARMDFDRFDAWFESAYAAIEPTVSHDRWTKENSQ